jgi:protein-L-isoaspartate(D-aspartate) O-methyltransferase
MTADPEQSEAALARRQMVKEQLAARGIRAPRVLEALDRIPRERFVGQGQMGCAYADGALPIDCQQTISQPYMVARMTELLEIEPTDRVLEIGTGSGYQTAVLALLALQVYTIEWHLKLLNQAASRLAGLGVHNVSFRCADGARGWAEHSPFDAIMVTAAGPEVPPALVAQLAPGGRLAAPIGAVGDQTLVLLRRTASGVEHSDVLRCRFVKLLGPAGWPE